MPVVPINGARAGRAVHGVSGPARRTHQVPALPAAGHRVVAMDDRGVPPGDAGGACTLADMVADTAGLIEHLGAAVATRRSPAAGTT
jgi:pimeloyl-ACP methyl ester carboxylesterase